VRRRDFGWEHANPIAIRIDNTKGTQAITVKHGGLNRPMRVCCSPRNELFTIPAGGFMIFEPTTSYYRTWFVFINSKYWF
jgi:hypothetical protein